jgi:hypothetical protein
MLGTPPAWPGAFSAAGGSFLGAPTVAAAQTSGWGGGYRDVFAQPSTQNRSIDSVDMTTQLARDSQPHRDSAVAAKKPPEPVGVAAPNLIGNDIFRLHPRRRCTQAIPIFKEYDIQTTTMDDVGLYKKDLVELYLLMAKCHRPTAAKAKTMVSPQTQ